MFFVVKWVPWYCTLPWMPASKPKKKNLPDALSRDAETLPFCCDFVVGELASVSVAVAFFGVFGPS